MPTGCMRQKNSASIEEDLKELAEMDPHAKTIQLLSANPLVSGYLEGGTMTT